MRVFLILLLGVHTVFASGGFTPLSSSEKLLTVGLSGLALTVGTQLGGPEEAPRWTGGVLGESWINENLGVSTASEASTWKRVSDWTVGALIATPALFPGSGGAEEQWQTLQSYSLTAISVQSLKSIFGRERPYAAHCRENRLGQDCFSGYRNESFVSGHSAFAFTAAGLMCAYRADGLCPIGFVLASGVAALRVVTHQHYLSDILVGGIMGWASGFYLSKWRGNSDTRDRNSDSALGFRMFFAVP